MRHGSEMRAGRAAHQERPTVVALRTVILHYHLFKNAGTSVDRILRDNFGDRWVTREFPGKGGNNTDLVTGWIQANPQAVAFSTHSAIGPIPRIDGVRIVSVVLLRDPIQRIRSAYRFERRQDAQTFGAVLAKETDFDGYVRVRLAQPHDRQCRNFQTQKLAAMVPGKAPELERATAALSKVSVLGLVEDFNGAMVRLKGCLGDSFPGFKINAVHMNASRPEPADQTGSAELLQRLSDTNQDDFRLIQAARQVSPSLVTPPEA